MAASTKQSAQSASESASPLPGASASESIPQAAQSASESFPGASAPEGDLPAADDSHVRLQFTGNKLVVAPFGELRDGQIVPVPREILAGVLATGLFIQVSDVAA